MTEAEADGEAVTSRAEATGTDGGTRQRWANLASLVLPGLLALGIDAVVLRSTLLHAGVLALLPAAAGVVTWSLAPRWELILAASTATALWAIPYQLPIAHLAGALAVGSLFLLPHRLLDHSPRLAPALGAGLLGGGGGLLVSQAPLGAAIGAGIGILTAVARPVAPTQGTLAALRTTSVYLPGASLLALLVVNAATGRMDTMTVPDALGFGVSLLALLALVALAGLGLATLFETRAPEQATAWAVLAAALGVVAASLVTRDPSTVVESVGFGALGLLPLAALFSARLASSLTSRLASTSTSKTTSSVVTMTFALPAILAALQGIG